MNSIHADETEEVMGINDRIQLEKLERYYYQKVAKSLMLKGVTIADIARFDARTTTLEIGTDTRIDTGVIFEGDVVIGLGCVIGPFVCLNNVTLGNHVEIKAHSVISGANIADHCIVGPFARIRPNTLLAAESHVGNFVEIKNSDIGKKSKINHLSYIGDTTIGWEVNIGAGTITCNYDGANKHRTVIQNDVFVGSNALLVAPLTVAKDVAAGLGLPDSARTGRFKSYRSSICSWLGKGRRKKKNKM